MESLENKQAKEKMKGDYSANNIQALEGLEAAVEGVVQKVLSEKIEGLLVKAIESAVTKEIERLKGILLADLKSDDGS